MPRGQWELRSYLGDRAASRMENNYGYCLRNTFACIFSEFLTDSPNKKKQEADKGKEKEEIEG